MEEERGKLVGIVTRDLAKAEPYNMQGFTDLPAALAETGADAVYVVSPIFFPAHRPRRHSAKGATCCAKGPWQ